MSTGQVTFKIQVRDDRHKRAQWNGRPVRQRTGILVA
jgi:hypothetical protein